MNVLYLAGMLASKIGENTAKWGLTQLGWIAICASGAGAIGTLAKKNYIATVLVIIVGGITATLLFKPDLISSIGSKIVEALNLAG